MMKFSLCTTAALSFAMSAMAAERSGHAAAELICGAGSYQAGKPVPVAVKLSVDPGWHSYWINPGEGGMPLKATWTLPAGWKAGALQQPVPKRFKTGDLPGFGYEGEAVFRVDLTPPPGATGNAVCKVKLAWLTCDDSACVPGDVELSLELPAGDGAASADAAVLAAAEKKIPVALPGLELQVEEKDGKIIHLFLKGPAGFDPTGCAVLPATPEVVDPAEVPSFVKRGDGWTAAAKKNEYLEGKPALLDIVLAGGKLEQPILVSWRAKE